MAVPLGEKLVILDNFDWYCDVTNIFIRQRHFKQSHEIIVIKIDESLNFVVKIKLKGIFEIFGLEQLMLFINRFAVY